MKSVFLTIFTLAAAVGLAQTPAAKPNQISGSITAVDASAKTLTVKPATGDPLTLTIGDRSFILHLAPGETDLKKAEKLTINDLTMGEDLVATYQPSADHKTNDVRTILVRTKADVDAMVKKQDDDWRRRGTTANIASVNASAKTFIIKSGGKDVTVKSGDKAEYMRYSPDSAKMSDAKTSSVADMKPGDEVHVLGDKNADGTEITAEKVVFGTFPQIAATVKSINAASNEMVVTDLSNKKPITIRVASDSAMKKLPDMAAQALARRYGAARGGNAAAADSGDAAGAGRGAGRGDGAGRGFGRGAGGGRGGDIGQILNQAPAITLADLKPGDAIMVKTTTGGANGPATAVTLLAGVEPILTAAPNSTRDIMSGWSLGGGGGGEGN